MGCGGSKYDLNPNIQGQTEKDIAILRQFGFEEGEVKKLFRCFKNIDMSEDGLIDIYELSVLLKCEVDYLVLEVFSEADQGKDGTINFSEYVEAMWLFLTRNNSGLAEFAFEMYDRDDTGVLTSTEVREMCEFVYGSNKLSTGKDRVKAIMSKLDSNKDGNVTKAEFVKNVKLVNTLLNPIFEMQGKLMGLSGGQKFWKAHTANRQRLMQDPKVRELFRKKKKNPLVSEGSICFRFSPSFSIPSILFLFLSLNSVRSTFSTHTQYRIEQYAAAKAAKKKKKMQENNKNSGSIISSTKQENSRRKGSAKNVRQVDPK